jgi:hypothetical protein
MPRDPNQRVRNTIGTASVAELVARCTILEPGIVLGRMSRHTSVHPTREAAIGACRQALEAQQEHVRNA